METAPFAAKTWETKCIFGSTNSTVVVFSDVAIILYGILTAAITTVVAEETVISAVEVVTVLLQLEQYCHLFAYIYIYIYIYSIYIYIYIYTFLHVYLVVKAVMV